eukprot:TRINITY_DN2482_c0_g1_i1.p1 TRINITY_DN2482_c0_g1~~TRINITY_DN2482_c0_g1_i1.p1  ORF type:complete len:699 (+),score=112.83 TRINITY_DN2482_c0_g1_i1:58-2154(+)
MVDPVALLPRAAEAGATAVSAAADVGVAAASAAADAGVAAASAAADAGVAAASAAADVATDVAQRAVHVIHARRGLSHMLHRFSPETAAKLDSLRLPLDLILSRAAELHTAARNIADAFLDDVTVSRPLLSWPVVSRFLFCFVFLFVAIHVNSLATELATYRNPRIHVVMWSQPGTTVAYQLPDLGHDLVAAVFRAFPPIARVLNGRAPWPREAFWPEACDDDWADEDIDDGVPEDACDTSLWARPLRALGMGGLVRRVCPRLRLRLGPYRLPFTNLTLGPVLLGYRGHRHPPTFMGFALPRPLVEPWRSLRSSLRDAHRTLRTLADGRTLAPALPTIGTVWHGLGGTLAANLPVYGASSSNQSNSTGGSGGAAGRDTEPSDPTPRPEDRPGSERAPTSEKSAAVPAAAQDATVFVGPILDPLPFTSHARRAAPSAPSDGTASAAPAAEPHVVGGSGGVVVDAGSDVIPDFIDWFELPNHFIIALSTLALVVIGLHPKRRTIGRRTVMVFGLLNFIRAYTVAVTTLPDPSPACHAAMLAGTFSQENPPSWEALVVRVINPSRLTCGDMIFSGHTTCMVVAALVVFTYLRPMHVRTWPTWTHRAMGAYRAVVMVLAGFGVFCVMATKLHYTLDVSLAVLITVTTWVVYHRLAASCLVGRRHIFVLSWLEKAGPLLPPSYRRVRRRTAASASNRRTSSRG